MYRPDPPEPLEKSASFWLLSIGALAYIILLAEKMPNFINGFLISAMASYFLFHSYITNRIRFKFKGNIYLWIMLLGGFAMMCNLISTK